MYCVQSFSVNELRDLAAYLDRQADKNVNQLALSVSDLIDLNESLVMVERDVEPTLQISLNHLSRSDNEIMNYASEYNANMLQLIEQSLDAEDGAPSNLMSRRQLTNQLELPVNNDSGSLDAAEDNNQSELPFSLSMVDDEMINDLIAYIERSLTLNDEPVEEPNLVVNGKQMNRPSKESLDQVRRQLF